MKLTPEQIAQYDRDGYLHFPELFSPQEVEALRREVAQVRRIVFLEEEPHLAAELCVGERVPVRVLRQLLISEAQRPPGIVSRHRHDDLRDGVRDPSPRHSSG